jgi:hypothetical protein
MALAAVVESSATDALDVAGAEDALISDEAVEAPLLSEAEVFEAFSQFWDSALAPDEEPAELEEEPVVAALAPWYPTLAELELLADTDEGALNVMGVIRAVAVLARLAVPLRTGAAEAAMAVIARRAMDRQGIAFIMGPFVDCLLSDPCSSLFAFQVPGEKYSPDGTKEFRGGRPGRACRPMVVGRFDNPCQFRAERRIQFDLRITSKWIPRGARNDRR